MKLYLIEMFGVSLFLTLIIELAVAKVLGIGFGKNQLPIILVNILTNPVVVLCCWLWRLCLPKINDMWLQLPVEGLVVWIEFIIYRSLVKNGWSCKKPFRLSLLANGASWLPGVMFSLIR